MSNSILKTISKLECIHIVQPVLNMGIHQKLGQSQNLSAQMKSVSESWFLSLFGCQCLDWFQVEIVIQMQIIQILSVDEKVQHVVTLSASLQASLNPVQSCRLEKFGCFEWTEQISLLLGFRRTMLECIENKIFQQFLVTDSHLEQSCKKEFWIWKDCQI